MKLHTIFGLVPVLLLVLVGCRGTLPPSTLPTNVPSPEPTAISAPSSPTAFPSPTVAVSPSPAAILADLSPPPDGWIAFRTPDNRLALVSPDGSRCERLTWTSQHGELLDYAWSPDGRRIAFTLESYRLHGLPGAQLALVSLEDARFIALTPPGAVNREFTWSQDSRFLAYLWRTNPQEERPSLALRVMDIATGQVVTVTTFSNQLLPDPEIPCLCPQPFPYPLLPVCMAGGCVLDIWDVQTGQKIVTLGSISGEYIWHPNGEWLLMPKVEKGKEGIKQEGVEEDVIHPLSLAVWRRGDEGPAVILEGTKRRSYLPVRWLPDGRLMVRVMEWEKDEYEGPAKPERVEYRFFWVDETGSIREAEGDLPWWAATGFPEGLEAAGLPRGQAGWWVVGPDGITVAFTWQWVEGDTTHFGIYLWRGEGEPVHLATGTGPQWQPGQFQP